MALVNFQVLYHLFLHQSIHRLCLFSLHEKGVFVFDKAVTNFGVPFFSAMPFKWQRSSGSSSEIKEGCQKVENYTEMKI